MTTRRNTTKNLHVVGGEASGDPVVLLLDLTDHLNQAQNFIELTCMAAESLSPEVSNPLCAGVYAAKEQLDAAKALEQRLRGLLVAPAETTRQ